MGREVSKTESELHAEIRALREHIAGLEGMLQQSSDQFDYQALLATSFEAVLVDVSGYILDATPAFEELMGYPAGAVKDFPLVDLLDDNSKLILKQVLTEADGSDYEVVGMMADGSPIPLRMRGREQFGGTRTLITVRDIRARNAALAAEREQRGLAEALQATSAVLNSSLDPTTVMERIIENVGRVVPHDAANLMIVEGDIARIVYWHGYPAEQVAFFENLELYIPEVSNLMYMRQSGRPFAIIDTDDYDGWITIKETSWVKSMASAPIRSGGQTLGFLNLDAATPGMMQQHHAERLQIFANQAAIALRNARLYEAAQEQIRVREEAEARLARQNLLLRTLNEVSHAAFARLEVSHIMDTVARLTAQILDVTSVYVCDWQVAEGTSTVLAEYISPKASELEQISDLGRVYNIEDLLNKNDTWLSSARSYDYKSLDDANISATDREQMQEYGAQSVLSIPLWMQGPVGYIEIWESRFPRQFSLNEIEIVQTIANSVAASLEKARLHAALQESEARNSAILNALPDTMFRFDRNFTFIDAKFPPDALLRNDNIIGKTLDEMAPEVADEGRHYINQVLDYGEMQLYEFQQVIGGAIHDFEARLVLSGTNEVLGIVRDITERKQAEAALAEARDQALEASRAKSQFLANMSHELRTPLNSIINYTQLVRDGLYGNLTPKQRDRLERVYRNGRNLLALINDVLDLSKIEAGHFKIVKSQVDTYALVRGVLDLLSPLAEEKGLVLEYEGGDTPFIMADETRIRQVLTNVIGNAIKFTPSGSVSVRTYQSNGSMLCFAIEDTGIGIPEEAKKTIFQEFHQVDSSTTRKFEGTGLGLAISTRIVQMHGGTIQVESELGQGSLFTILLPIESVSQQA